jgi:hypothetical protein
MDIFDELPNEILDHIFTFLDLKTLGTCSQVSKSFNDSTNAKYLFPKKMRNTILNEFDKFKKSFHNFNVSSFKCKLEIIDKNRCQFRRDSINNPFIFLIEKDELGQHCDSSKIMDSILSLYIVDFKECFKYSCFHNSKNYEFYFRTPYKMEIYPDDFLVTYNRNILNKDLNYFYICYEITKIFKMMLVILESLQF